MTATIGMVAAVLLAFGGSVLAGFDPSPFMEWVTVGDPGNADDTHGAGYGGVDYVHNIDIGRHEVTNAQYCVFLNAAGTNSRNRKEDRVALGLAQRHPVFLEHT